MSPPCHTHMPSSPCQLEEDISSLRSQLKQKELALEQSTARTAEQLCAAEQRQGSAESRIQDLRTQLETKQQFLSSVSHTHFSTPSVMSYCHVILLCVDPSTCRSTCTCTCRCIFATLSVSWSSPSGYCLLVVWKNPRACIKANGEGRGGEGRG